MDSIGMKKDFFDAFFAINVFCQYFFLYLCGKFLFET